MKAIFLDRDGVINKYLPNDYVKTEEEFIVLQGFKDFIENHKKKYKFIVVTNQSGINKGIVSYNFFINSCKRLIKDYSIDAIYFCPHKEEENCKCRKPKTLLLEKAIKRFSINVEDSYFIGDSYTDFLAAKKLNIKFILVLTGKTNEEEVKKWEIQPYMIISHLYQLKL